MSHYTNTNQSWVTIQIPTNHRPPY